MAAARTGVALVGHGDWGRHVARNLAALGSLAAICDADPRARRAARRSHPLVPVAAAIGRILEDASIRAVVVATPSATHYALARRALLADKDVLVEKPLALRLADARALVALARRRRRVLMVGHVLEYHPGVRRLRALVSSGRLGRLRYLYSNRLNLGKVRKEENILWSFAPHDVSLMLLLAGRLPARVSTSGGAYLQRRIADVTMTSLAFPSGTRAHIFVSWLHPYKEQKLVVIGSRRMAVFDDGAPGGRLRLFDRRIAWTAGAPVPEAGAETLVPFAAAEPLREELRHFVACVRTRRRPRTDGRSAVAVLRVLDACQRSIERGGRPVAIGSR